MKRVIRFKFGSFQCEDHDILTNYLKYRELKIKAPFMRMSRTFWKCSKIPQSLFLYLNLSRRETSTRSQQFGLLFQAKTRK